MFSNASSPGYSRFAPSFLLQELIQQDESGDEE